MPHELAVAVSPMTHCGSTYQVPLRRPILSLNLLNSCDSCSLCFMLPPMLWSTIAKIELRIALSNFHIFVLAVWSPRIIIELLGQALGYE
jgi:hypothetical protein